MRQIMKGSKRNRHTKLGRQQILFLSDELNTQSIETIKQHAGKINSFDIFKDLKEVKDLIQVNVNSTAHLSTLDLVNTTLTHNTIEKYELKMVISLKSTIQDQQINKRFEDDFLSAKDLNTGIYCFALLTPKALYRGVCRVLPNSLGLDFQTNSIVKDDITMPILEIKRDILTKEDKNQFKLNYPDTDFELIWPSIPVKITTTWEIVNINLNGAKIGEVRREVSHFDDGREDIYGKWTPFNLNLDNTKHTLTIGDSSMAVTSKDDTKWHIELDNPMFMNGRNINITEHDVTVDTKETVEIFYNNSKIGTIDRVKTVDQADNSVNYTNWSPGGGLHLDMDHLTMVINSSNLTITSKDTTNWPLQVDGSLALVNGGIIKIRQINITPANTTSGNYSQKMYIFESSYTAIGYAYFDSNKNLISYIYNPNKFLTSFDFDTHTPHFKDPYILKGSITKEWGSRTTTYDIPVIDKTKIPAVTTTNTQEIVTVNYNGTKIGTIERTKTTYSDNRPATYTNWVEKNLNLHGTHYTLVIGNTNLSVHSTDDVHWPISFNDVPYADGVVINIVQTEQNTHITKESVNVIYNGVKLGVVERTKTDNGGVITYTDWIPVGIVLDNEHYTIEVNSYGITFTSKSDTTWPLQQNLQTLDDGIDVVVNQVIITPDGATIGENDNYSQAVYYMDGTAYNWVALLYFKPNGDLISYINYDNVYATFNPTTKSIDMKPPYIQGDPSPNPIGSKVGFYTVNVKKDTVTKEVVTVNYNGNKIGTIERTKTVKTDETTTYGAWTTSNMTLERDFYKITIGRFNIYVETKNTKYPLTYDKDNFADGLTLNITQNIEKIENASIYFNNAFLVKLKRVSTNTTGIDNGGWQTQKWAFEDDSTVFNGEHYRLMIYKHSNWVMKVASSDGVNWPIQLDKKDIQTTGNFNNGFETILENYSTNVVGHNYILQQINRIQTNPATGPYNQLLAIQQIGTTSYMLIGRIYFDANGNMISYLYTPNSQAKAIISDFKFISKVATWNGHTDAGNSGNWGARSGNYILKYN